MITVTDNAGNQSVGKNSILPKIDQNFFQVDLKDYRIVSTPFYPEGGRFLDEIKLTNGENPRNKNEFHVWQITSQSAMASNPFGDFTFSDSLSPGQAILIRTKSATNINVKPGARVAIHNVFQIPLHPGWNLIGNPFLFKMHIQNIRPIELVNQTFKLRKGFDKPGAGHRIDQFDGLLLWAFPDDTLLSFLPDSNKVDSTLAGFLVNPTNTDTTYIGFSADTTQYNLAITAVSGDHSDTIFLGLKDDSKTEWDPYDMIDPPSLNSTVQIYFDHLEWVGHEGNYSQDIHRFPIENTGQWRFKIFSKENVGKLHLKFKASPDLLNEFRIQLFSNQDNSTYTTIPSIEYVYNCTPLEIQQSTQSALSFIIILDEESQKKSAKQHKQNIEADAVTFSSYPNPFESVTSFRIQIQNEMFLSLQIHDLNGRLIRSFFDKKYFSSGVHDSLWDGRDSHGMMVSSGIYMARLITEKNQVFVQKITHIK